MSGKIARITRYSGKGKPGEQLNEAKLITGLGLEGNIKQGGERQICLLAAESLEQMERQPVRGLCFGRFKEDILVESLSFDEPRDFDCLSVGNAVLRISPHAKKCFGECALFAGGAPCPLSRGALFAAVEKGGVIRVGDNVEKL